MKESETKHLPDRYSNLFDREGRIEAFTDHRNLEVSDIVHTIKELNQGMSNGELSVSNYRLSQVQTDILKKSIADGIPEEVIYIPSGYSNEWSEDYDLSFSGGKDLATKILNNNPELLPAWKFILDEYSWAEKNMETSAGLETNYISALKHSQKPEMRVYFNHIIPRSQREEYFKNIPKAAFLAGFSNTIDSVFKIANDILPHENPLLSHLKMTSSMDHPNELQKRKIGKFARISEKLAIISGSVESEVSFINNRGENSARMLLQASLANITKDSSTSSRSEHSTIVNRELSSYIHGFRQKQTDFSYTDGLLSIKRKTEHFTIPQLYDEGSPFEIIEELGYELFESNLDQSQQERMQQEEQRSLRKLRQVDEGIYWETTPWLIFDTEDNKLIDLLNEEIENYRKSLDGPTHSDLSEDPIKRVKQLKELSEKNPYYEKEWTQRLIFSDIDRLLCISGVVLNEMEIKKLTSHLKDNAQNHKLRLTAIQRRRTAAKNLALGELNWQDLYDEDNLAQLESFQDTVPFWKYGSNRQSLLKHILRLEKVKRFAFHFNLITPEEQPLAEIAIEMLKHPR